MKQSPCRLPNCKRRFQEFRPLSPRAVLLVCAAAALSLAACGQRSGASADRDESSPTPESGGYVSPPALTGAVREAGDVALQGRGQAGARVRLAAPDGWSTETTVGRDGRWTVRAPLAAEPRMYALGQQAGARSIRAEGAVMTLPAPAAPALLVRAGYAALPLPAPAPKPVILTIDFDAAGAAAVGGLAPPDARVQLAADGQISDADMADRGGRFALLAPRSRAAPAEGRRFVVSAPQGLDEIAVNFSPAQPLAPGQALRANRGPAGWRVDWAVPGGGVQTTLVLDRAAAAGDAT